MTIRIRSVFIPLVILAVVPAVAAQEDDQVSGRQRFETNCATCHGSQGSPDSRSPVVDALGVMPADLSDPLFNSREPAQDWQMVVKHGGAALGLSAKMPAFGEALDDEQIQDTVAYIKRLADTREYPPGEMNLMLPIRTKKAFPEDEVVYQGRMTRSDGDDEYRNVLEFEKRIGKRGQAIVEIVHESDGDRSEVTEAEVGYKQALSFSQRHVFSAAAVLAFPVASGGDEELQIYVAYGRELSASWTLQASSGLKFPFDAFGDGDIELGAIVHYVHSPWPRNVFPAMELTATKPLDSDNGDLEWTALPQIRIGLTRGGHVALNLGVELPLTGQPWDQRYHLTLLWDFADGGFFKGW